MTSKSHVLVLDSSLSGVSMALVTPSSIEPLWSRINADHMGSAKTIGLAFQDCLQELGGDVSKIAGVSVSVGPGSFTGIKVGLSFVYGLSAAIPNLSYFHDCAIEQAFIGLCKDSKKNFSQMKALFVRATRTHGYGFVPGRGAVLVDASDPRALDLGSIGDFLSMGDWPVLTEAAHQSGVKMTTIESQVVCSAAIYGMCERAANVFPLEFSNEKPRPNYMRLSTAEEKIGRAVTGETLNETT
jgi:hypothetical protein